MSRTPLHNACYFIFCTSQGDGSFDMFSGHVNKSQGRFFWPFVQIKKNINQPT